MATKSKNEPNVKLIKEVSVDLNSVDLKKSKNHKAVKKLKIFDHLEEDEKTEAEIELLGHLGITQDTGTQPDEGLENF